MLHLRRFFTCLSLSACFGLTACEVSSAGDSFGIDGGLDGGEDAGGQGAAGAGGAENGGADAGGSMPDGGLGGQGGGGGEQGGAGQGGQGGTLGCVTSADCQNGLFCDGVEGCLNGACVAGEPVPCDDGLPCTTDVCDEAAGACSHAANDSLCDDGTACNGVESCSSVLGCLPGLPLACDDGVGCTSDFCDQASGACAHVASDAACQDGLFCDGVEVCDPATGAAGTGCLPGAPIDCQDGIGCTVDACDEQADNCAHAPDPSSCDDGEHCNGVETCITGLGCQQGTPVVCDDGLSCTLDACSDELSACTHTPVHAACDDGLACNGVEACSPMGPAPSGCTAGTPIPCGSDGVGCTLDACDEALAACVHTPSSALCAPGELCIVLQSGCSSAPPCATGADCDDGNACNGLEACVNGTCAAGAPVDCEDFVGCTTDSCDPTSGACLHPPSDALCSDGLACNGAETCDPTQGCVAGAAVVCGDGVACTVDSCQEPTGTCQYVPNHGACTDGQLCNGAETCSPTLGCLPGAPFVCPSDGIACTSDVCDPAANACVHTPDDALCGCGQTCSAQAGCGNFCVVATCQGKVYECGDCGDNDGDCKIDSADGMCLGPCDNSENGFVGGIPGQNKSPCKQDCYFDADTGSGNDDCYWSHKCDPNEAPPNYAPEGSQCAYNPNASIPGSGGTCASVQAAQSNECADYCGPLTPNGCDCFGCCAIPGAPTPVWLGSENPAGTPSCTLATLADPSACKPCTQVTACLNPCETCEVCIGKPTLPPGCGAQSCGEAQPCGLAGQALCPMGLSCVTGCCTMNPM